MDFKDCLILGVIGLSLGAFSLASRADYYEMKTRQLETEIIELKADHETEIIELKAKHEGFKESALMLND